jgi:hypothetical protein
MIKGGSVVCEFIFFRKTIASGDDPLKNDTLNTSCFCFMPFEGKIKPPAVRVVVDSGTHD